MSTTTQYLAYPRDRFARGAWIDVALRLVPKEYHRIIAAQFHVLMDRIQEEHDRATVLEKNLKIACDILDVAGLHTDAAGLRLPKS